MSQEYNFSEEEMRLEIVKTGKKMYDKGLIVANEGNISVKISENEILITPRGKCKGELKIDDIVRVNINQKKGEIKNKVSSEYRMHLEVYKRVKKIRAVIHAHPPFATAFACARISLSEKILPEALIFLKKIPLARYATPGTIDVALSIREWINKYPVILLSNHGVLSTGENLKEVFFNLERVEHLAKINWICRDLDGAVELKSESR